MAQLINESPYLLPIPETWDKAITEFEMILRARGLREASIDTRIRHLRRYARDIGVETPQQVTQDAFIQWTGRQRWAPETRHSYYMSIKAFYKFLEHPRMLKTLENIGRTRRPIPPPRPIPDEVVREAIYNAVPRTRLILQLAAELGLRRGEIANVHHQDISVDNGKYYLTVKGKGGQKRILPVHHQLGETIKNQSKLTGWLFPGLCEGHLSPRHIGKLASQALPEPWTLHTLRHRFATTAYEGTNHDIIAVQTALGHQNIATTQRYAKHHKDALLQVVKATKL